MKRKIFKISVLSFLALMLVVVMGVVLAAPAGADSTYEPTIGWWQSSNPDSGVAEYTTAQSHSADWSVHLEAFKAYSPGDYHEVYVANPTGVDSLADLDNVSFWYYCPAGGDPVAPLVDVWLDLDDSYSRDYPPSGDDEWLLGMIDDVTAYDEWVEVTHDDIEWVRATGGTVYGTGSAGLAAALVDLTDRPVLAIGIETGGPGTYISSRAGDQEFYVDDLAINDSTYAMRVINQTQDTGYNTIQAAIDDATDGDTIIVAVGTYGENIELNKAITLLGAQHDVDPAGSTERSGGESVITGQVRISATATFNGFKLDGNQIIISGAAGATASYNIILDSGSHGVYIEPSSPGAQVLYNTISNPAWQAISNQGNSGVIISNNHITGAGTGGGEWYTIFPIESALGTGTGIQIINNVISGCTGSKGIHYQGGNGAVISGNSINGTTYEGIHLISGQGHLVENNTLENINNFAICTQVQATISGNTISDGFWGIVLSSGHEGDVVEANTIENMSGFAIYADSQASISDNIITACNDGIRINYAGSSETDRVEVIDNTISYTKYAGINIYGAAYTYVHGNTVHHCNYYGENGTGDWDYAAIHIQDQDAPDTGTADNCIIDGNTVYDSINGIQTWSDNTIIRNNHVYNMGLTYDDEKLEYVDRLFMNSAIIVGSNWASDNYDPVGTVIEKNNLHDNYWGVFYSADLTNGIAAAKNWWGDASGPEHASNTGGMGDAVSTNVDYSPWLGATTGTTPMTWYTNDSIQDAITAAAAGDTINVVAGTYDEAVSINVLVNLVGVADGDELPTITNTVTLSSGAGGTTINGMGFLVPEGITENYDSISLNGISDVTIEDCHFDGNGTFILPITEDGLHKGARAIQMNSSSSNIEVLNCTFENGYYLAIQGYAPGVTVTDCDITNCKSGINLQGGGDLEVTNTDISVVAQRADSDTYCVRFASSGGSTPDMAITGGTFTVDKNGLTADEDTYHSAIVVRSGATGTLSVNGASINGEVVNLSSTELDATMNWWGSTASPATTISGDVDYSPWWGANYVGDDHLSPWIWYTDDSIQEAINTATDYDTINVVAGQYDERITITKPLTLLGATHGVNKNGYIVPTDYSWNTTVESVINNPEPALTGTVSVVLIQDTDDVTFDGFVVQSLNAPQGSENDMLVTVLANTMTMNNIVIRNNVIGPNTNIDPLIQNGDAGRMGLYLSVHHFLGDEVFGLTNSTIAGNKIFDCKGDGDNVFVWGTYESSSAPGPAPMNGTFIRDNEICGSHRSGIETAGGITGLTIQGNDIYGNSGLPTDPDIVKFGSGITLVRGSSDRTETGFATANVTIHNNRIYDNEKHAIYLDPNNKDIFITNNEFFGNLRDTVVVDLTGYYYNPEFDLTSGPFNSFGGSENVVIHGNDIDSKGEYGVVLLGEPTNGFVVNAARNWWGTNVGTEIRSKVHGKVLYAPWYADESMTTLDSDLPVHNTTQGTDHATMQEAIDFASDGDTINVDAGEYDENIDINKRITLQGAGSDNVTGTVLQNITSTAFIDSSPYDWKPVVIISASGINGSPVLIQDLLIKVDQDTASVYTPGILPLSGSSISYVTLDNVHITGTHSGESDSEGANESGPVYV